MTVAESNPRFDPERARRALSWCATAGAFLVFIVIVASAFLRLAQAADAWPEAIVIVRFAHRVAAIGVGFLVVAIVVVCWTVRRKRSGEPIAAFVLVALTVFLSVLGRATPGAELPAVTLGNLLGGMAMLGLFWWLRLSARDVKSAQSRGIVASTLMWTGLALFALELAVGAFVSASHAQASCKTIPDCDGRWWPPGESLAVLDPRRAFEAPSGPAPLLEARRQALHMAHRFGALLVLAYWTFLAVILRWRNRLGARASAVVAALLAAEMGLGVAVVSSGAILAAVAHNAWAALILLAAVRAVFYSRLAEEASVSDACQTVTSK